MLKYFSNIFSCHGRKALYGGCRQQIQTQTILLQCADVFLSLAESNRKCSDQATHFYHRKMVGKMAQTQKHCAAFLIEVAIALPSIHPDLQGESQSVAYPIPTSRSHTNTRRQRPLPGWHSYQDIRRRYRDDICLLIRDPAELKKYRCRFCKNTSSLTPGPEVPGSSTGRDNTLPGAIER